MIIVQQTVLEERKGTDSSYRPTCRPNRYILEEGTTHRLINDLTSYLPMLFKKAYAYRSNSFFKKIISQNQKN